MRAKALLARRHEHRILALMLVVLHGAIWWDFASPASRSLMLAHLGLFLLWQPIWSREERLQASSAAVSMVAILALVVWLDWWLLTAWMVLLTGLVGGRMTEGRAERGTYMLTLVFLLSELLIGTIPAMFGVRVHGLAASIIAYGLPVLAVVIALIPTWEGKRGYAQAVDFLYGLTTSLLVTVLAMGSLLRMYEAGVSYPVALFQTILGIACFLLAISWLWMPFAGFSGLGQLWTRYLMNIGTPFEVWLGRIAELSRRLPRPDEFMRAAVHELVGLPWVSGVRWTTERGASELAGQETGHHFMLRDGDLQVTVHAQAPLGAALLLHGRLLVGLLAHFHRAKQRELELTRRTHLEAVHETGARITHDIKNLLQSLYTLTSAMQGAHSQHDQERLLTLLERQLPTLSQRLQLALDKLQAPQQGNDRSEPVSGWWQGLRERHEGQSIAFDAALHSDPPVPVELFDSVVENLLDNALYKRQTSTGLRIEVTLKTAADGRISLTVRDSGAAPPVDVQRDLLRGPVPSSSGLGIGLYQASRYASTLGYRLRARGLRDGEVCFELEGPLPRAPGTAGDTATGPEPGATAAAGPAPGGAPESAESTAATGTGTQRSGAGHSPPR